MAGLRFGDFAEDDSNLQLRDYRDNRIFDLAILTAQLTGRPKKH